MLPASLDEKEFKKQIGEVRHLNRALLETESYRGLWNRVAGRVGFK